MKRKLQLIGLLLFASVFTTYGQQFLSENFTGTVFPPTGWTISTQAGNWARVQTATAGGTAPELRFSWQPQFNNISRFTSPSMDLSANETGSVAISFRHMVDHYGGPYQLGLAYSDKGGDWQNIWTINPTASIPAELILLSLDESQFPVNSNDVRIAIFFSGNSFNINFWYIDDISVSAFTKDASLAAVGVPDLVFGETPVTGTVINNGFGEITSFDINWQLDDGPVQTQTFSGLNLDFGDTFEFETTSTIEPVTGTYNLKVSVSNVNGEGEDDNPDNDLIQKSIHVFDPDQITYRPLFESFSSSTCPPCAPFNLNVMNPFIEQYKEHLTIIKYQMNWPGSGDPYYTAEGGVRRSYYGVSGVPSIVIDGAMVATNATAVRNAFINGLNKSAQIQLSGIHNLDETVINVQVEINPSITINDLRLHVVVVEKVTTGNATTNGETEFHYVMMKMIPNAQGTVINLVEGEPLELNFSMDLVNTHVEDFDDLAVAVFIQNHGTKMVYQSAFTTEGSFFSVNFDINNDQEDVAIDGVVNINFSAPVTFTDDSEITNENVGNLISYYKSNDRQNVDFTATISEDKKHINITPDHALDFNSEYTVILSPVKAPDGTITDPITLNFTTRESAGAPIVSFNIQDGETDVAIDVVATIELNQAVRMADGSEITAEDLPQLIMFHETDQAGNSVAFTATINSEKTLITITPSAELENNQLYMLGIGELLGVDNELSDPVHITFTTEEGLFAGFLTEGDLHIFPNPAANRVHISLPEQVAGATVRIFDQSGKLAHSVLISGNSTQVDVKNLSDGIYFVEVTGEGFIVRKKLLIAR